MYPSSNKGPSYSLENQISIQKIEKERKRFRGEKVRSTFTTKIRKHDAYNFSVKCFPFEHTKLLLRNHTTH